MYSKKSFDDSNHLPIFLILALSNLASFIAHAPPARFEWVSILYSRIFLMVKPNISAEIFILELISQSVTLLLPTLSQYAHKSVVPLDVSTQICVTRLASAFTGHANICHSNAPWCTHAPLNEFSVQ